jgi:hypothetical protein
MDWLEDVLETMICSHELWGVAAGFPFSQRLELL